MIKSLRGGWVNDNSGSKMRDTTRMTKWLYSVFVRNFNCDGCCTI